jgi:hypothetical protein
MARAAYLDTAGDLLERRDEHVAIGLVAAFIGLGAERRSDRAPVGRPTAKEELARVQRFVPPKVTPTTRPAPTTTTPLPSAAQARDAIALAKRLGCARPKIGRESDISGFAVPTQVVSCTIRDVDLTVEVFATHADLAKLLGRALGLPVTTIDC